MSEFDYLPEYGLPPEEVPYGRYQDSGPSSPTGRHRSAGQPDYGSGRSYGVPEHMMNDGRRPPNGQPSGPPRGQRNGRGYPSPPPSGPMQAYQPPNGGPVRGYPPSPGNTPTQSYPPYSDPIRTYRPELSDPRTGRRPDMSGPISAYQPGMSGPMQAYKPDMIGMMAAYEADMNGSMTAYRPDMSGPMTAYQPGMSGPMPAYQQPDMNGTMTLQPDLDGGMPGYELGMSGPMTALQPDMDGQMPGYQRGASGQMQAYQPGMSGPMQAYQTPASRPARGSRGGTGLLSDSQISEPIQTYQPPPARRTPQRSSSNGKEILSWLPFGNRVMLVPKDLMDDDGEELREHRDVSDGWLRPAVFGAMDGLVTNVSLIAGVGATMGAGARGMIIVTGIAGLIAGAFSMATGEYISVSSQNELNLAEVELERKQHARDPQGKLRRLAHLFVEKGVSPNLAEAVVRQISADPERAVAAHLQEELGIDPDDLPSPRTAAIASLASFTVGALIPLAPFLLGYSNLKVALVASAAAAFLGGAAVAKLTGRPMLLGGLRQLFAAALGAGAAFGIGHAIGGHVS